MVTAEFIKQYRDADVLTLALQRNRYPEVDIDFALQQIEGYQRSRDKLPTLSNIEGWLFPPRLNIEQCSSEATAQFKASLVQGNTLVDLTGGYGIDTYFLSQHFRHTDYVEQNAQLAQIADHNFRLTKRDICVHNALSQDFLEAMPKVDCIYLDPARRGRAGQKVVRMEDCQPNVVELYPQLRQHCDILLLKLSPICDIDVALRSLPDAEAVYVVESNGEVKELLVLCRFANTRPITITAVQLTKADAPHTFTFAPEEEHVAMPHLATQLGQYLYEPAPAILKAGAFKTVGNRYNIAKLAINTHLYTAEQYIPDFRGRVFRIVSVAQKKELQQRQLNIITRNYPQDIVALRRSLRIKEGGSDYLIATRLCAQPMLLLAQRLQ